MYECNISIDYAKSLYLHLKFHDFFNKKCISSSILNYLIEK